MDRPVSLQQPQVIPSTDRLGRSLRELRLSVIDRCNFRCTYCMPEDGLERVRRLGAMATAAPLRAIRRPRSAPRPR